MLGTTEPSRRCPGARLAMKSWRAFLTKGLEAWARFAVNIGKELDALFLRDALQEDSIGAASEEGLFHQHIPFGDSSDSLAPFAILW